MPEVEGQSSRANGVSLAAGQAWILGKPFINRIRAIYDCILYNKTSRNHFVGWVERSATHRRLDLESAPRTRILVLTGGLGRNDARHPVRRDGGLRFAPTGIKLSHLAGFQ